MAIHLHHREIRIGIHLFLLMVTDAQGAFPKVRVKLAYFIAGTVGAFARTVTPQRLHKEALQEIEAVTQRTVVNIPLPFLHRRKLVFLNQESTTDKMVQVDSVPRIELMRIRCLVVRNRRKLLIKRSARLIRKRHTRRMLPIDKALYRHAPRSHAVQLRTIHRRKVDLASRCVIPLALIRTTKSHIAQKTFANSQGKSRIKTQFHIEFRIGRKHRSHGIVSAHSLVNKVAVVHALDITRGQTVVAHIACSRSHSLIYRRVNLFFGQAQLVRDISLHPQFLGTKTGIQIGKPTVF